MNTEAAVRDAVLATLRRVAPGMEAAALDPDADLREQLDLDSVDALRFFVALKESVGVDVPERDYGGLRTLNACVRYVQAHQPARE